MLHTVLCKSGFQTTTNKNDYEENQKVDNHSYHLQTCLCQAAYNLGAVVNMCQHLDISSPKLVQTLLQGTFTTPLHHAALQR